MTHDEILLKDWLRHHLQSSGAISRLSGATGLARTTIHRILNGKTDPDPSTLALIAGALNVPVPQVEKMLVVRVPVPEETALSLIADAQRQLNRAARKLEGVQEARGRKKGTGSPAEAPQAPVKRRKGKEKE